MLGEPRRKGDLMPRLQRLTRAGITIHAQIVLCPGWNDGAQLERSVRDLATLYPGVRTTAVVPVGLTAHRSRLPELRPLGPEEARSLVDTVGAWQREFRARLGSRFVFLGDEVYLLAGAPLPPAAAYEGFPVVEDGVGLVRRFEDGFARALARLPRALPASRSVVVVTGEMFGPRLDALVGRVRVRGLTARVVPVPNRWFGPGIQVAGLLTGQDIQSQLVGRTRGAHVLVPDVALKDGDGVFLDDVTPGDLAGALGAPVSAVPASADGLLTAMMGGRCP
jgi:putative radical SAM enzyme (TIGR03279 family)